jgi:hypothetical protein
LDTTGCTDRATDKVPKELAVEQTPKSRPYTVNAGSDGNETGIFVPNEITHQKEEEDKGKEVKYEERRIFFI